jgi:hypothetical protein
MKRERNPKLWFGAGLGLLFLLHQDFWLWEDTTLVFGFLPVGLAYHALFTLFVVIFWAISLHYYWPDNVHTGNDDAVNTNPSNSQDDPL